MAGNFQATLDGDFSLSSSHEAMDALSGVPIYYFYDGNSAIGIEVSSTGQFQFYDADDIILIEASFQILDSQTDGVYWSIAGIAQQADFTGGDLGDVLIGGTVNDTLDGGAGNDTLYGGLGNNTIDGGSGIDTLDYSNFIGRFGGVIVDLTGGYARENGPGFSFGDSFSNIENVVGSSGEDLIFGDNGSNVIEGGAGGDDLDALGGSDTLSYANSSTGVTVNLLNNTTSGGDADGDVINNFENILGSSADDQLTGDNNANVLTGGAGDDNLFSNGGADRLSGGTGFNGLFGGDGSDVYILGPSGFDAVVENSGGGTDTVKTARSYTLTNEVERLQLIGTGDINGTGNSLRNIISGNAEDNIIDGKAGNDYLIGRGGSDTFAFSSALGATEYNRIADFSHVDDSIKLDTSVFAGLEYDSLGVLSADQFAVIGNGVTKYGADARIIYNEEKGVLSYDADGAGGVRAIKFAVLNHLPTLDHTDFVNTDMIII